MHKQQTMTSNSDLISTPYENNAQYENNDKFNNINNLFQIIHNKIQQQRSGSWNK